MKNQVIAIEPMIWIPRFIASTIRNDDVSFRAFIVRIDLDQQSTFHYVDGILFVWSVCVLCIAFNWPYHTLIPSPSYLQVPESCKISSISVNSERPTLFGNCGSGVNDIYTFDTCQHKVNMTHLCALSFAIAKQLLRVGDRNLLELYDWHTYSFVHSHTRTRIKVKS